MNNYDYTMDNRKVWGEKDSEDTPPCKVCGGYVSEDRCFEFQGEIIGFCPDCEVMIDEMIETLGSVGGGV